MAVHCTKCGEELLGAVNRCWRCGLEFEVRGGDSDRPPVRRPPVVSQEAVLVAELAGQDEADQDQADEGGERGPAPSATSEPRVTATIRRGSPFGDRGTATVEQVTVPLADDTLDLSPRRPRYPKFGGSSAGAALTFPLGLTSLLIAFFFPVGSLLLSATGIALGTWGLYSRHRGFALAGLLLCCLSLAVAGFNGTVEIYERMYGLKPWENADPSAAPMN